MCVLESDRSKQGSYGLLGRITLYYWHNIVVMLAVVVSRSNDDGVKKSFKALYLMSKYTNVWILLATRVDYSSSFAALFVFDRCI